jgi:hypothetical protein
MIKTRQKIKSKLNKSTKRRRERQQNRERESTLPVALLCQQEIKLSLKNVGIGDVDHWRQYIYCIFTLQMQLVHHFSLSFSRNLPLTISVAAN